VPEGATSGLEPFSQRLGHAFRDPALLELALTHRSWCAEHAGTASNERLEFLGDSVLGLAVTDHLFASYPDVAEGQLAKVRASVVSAPTLGAVAREIDLGAELRLGKGEEQSGGRHKQSILADGLEAVIGAVHVDAGWAVARALVLRLLGDRILVAATGPGGEDFKTLLQEHVARRYDAVPSYLITEEGPDHGKRFFATVLVSGEELGRGQGSSKKQAEQDAARVAWAELGARELAQRTAAQTAAAASSSTPTTTPTGFVTDLAHPGAMPDHRPGDGHA
jgi:ribonuclease-3